MLVLSRRVGERIEVGDGIVLTVVAIMGTKVKIGIQAPPEMPVHRAEVAERIRAVHAPIAER